MRLTSGNGFAERAKMRIAGGGVAMLVLAFRGCRAALPGAGASHPSWARWSARDEAVDRLGASPPKRRDAPRTSDAAHLDTYPHPYLTGWYRLTESAALGVGNLIPMQRVDKTERDVFPGFPVRQACCKSGVCWSTNLSILLVPPWLPPSSRLLKQYL